MKIAINLELTVDLVARFHHQQHLQHTVRLVLTQAYHVANATSHNFFKHTITIIIIYHTGLTVG